MDTTKGRGKQNVEASDKIAGDRREDRRYGLQLELKWKLIRRRRVLDTGAGKTVDLSSGGVLFDCGRVLPEGLNAELSVAWPVLLHNAAPLQLVISGRIVRARGNQVAIRATQYEFRTVGVASEFKNAMAATGRTPAIMTRPEIFSSLGKFQ
jgi:hypothetical protein